MIHLDQVHKMAQQSKALGHSDGKLFRQLESATRAQTVAIIAERIRTAKTLEDLEPDAQAAMQYDSQAVQDGLSSSPPGRSVIGPRSS